MTTKNSKGFTLAELLVVVAIIAVLVAFAIPVFQEKLEVAREAVELSEIRNAYSLVMSAATDQSFADITEDSDPRNDTSDWDDYIGRSVSFRSGTKYYCFSPVKVLQHEDGWQINGGINVAPPIGDTDSSGAPAAGFGTTYHYWYILYDYAQMKPYLYAK